MFDVLPTITDVSPQMGAPGTAVTITGTALTGATFVSFGGIVTSNLTVNSDNEITVQVPSNALGGLLSVGTPAGVALDGLFTVLGFNRLYFTPPFAVASTTNGQLTINLHIDRTNGQPTQTTTARYIVQKIWGRGYAVGLRSAEPGVEFTQTQGSVTFAPNSTDQTVNIIFPENSPYVSPSLFAVWLGYPSSDSELAEPRQAAVVRDYSDYSPNKYQTRLFRNPCTVPLNPKLTMDWSPLHLGNYEHNRWRRSRISLWNRFQRTYRFRPHSNPTQG